MWPDREQSGNYKTHSCLLGLGLGLAKLDQTLLMSNILVPPPRFTDPLLGSNADRSELPKCVPNLPWLRGTCRVTRHLSHVAP